jgi:predicted ATPase
MEAEGDKIRVLFGPRKALNEPVPPNSVLIVPSTTRWNDFGYRTRVDVRIRLSNRETDHTTSAFIGFITNLQDAPNGLTKLEELLEDVSDLTLPANDSYHFFMMLPSMDAYRQMVQDLNLDSTVAVLTAMKDVVALTEFKAAGTNWLNAATSSDVFLKSFVRNTDAYFAYKNAGSILRGLQHEEFRKLSKTISIRFQLPGRQNPHALNFQFDHEANLPKRIAVIIGKNGVGKSQALGRIVRSLLDGDDSLFDADTNSRVLLNRILAFAPTNEARSVFPSEVRKRPRIWYRRFTLNRSGTVRQGTGVSDQILQVARSTERIGRYSRWQIFLSAIRAIDHWEQLCLPTRHEIRSSLPLNTLNDGGEQISLENFAAINPRTEPIRVINGNAYPLSSGEISFLRFAAQASLHIENGSLLLLDEPETHLHPNFISQFVALLDRLLEQTGSAAIIATHSAYFVREVFRDQVTVLRTDPLGYVSVEPPTLRTFGADVGAISYFVFGEDEPSRLAKQVEGRLRDRFDTWEAVYAEYKDELSLELLGALRDSMEDGTNE